MKAALFTLLALAAFAVKGEYLGTPPTAEAAAAASEDFITASLVTISPGRTMYALVGHTALRLRTKDGRDLCFSYESESASQRVLSYLAGRLRMGMFAVPTLVYLDVFRGEGRTVRDDVLNLSPEARLWLWQSLDGRAHEGVDLPYDPIVRGCAKTAFMMICDAAGDDLELPELSDSYDRTVREMLMDAIPDSPWSAAFITGVTGREADADLPRLEKVFLPSDLLDVLSAAKYRGRAFLGPTTLLLDEPPLPPPARTADPLYVALGFLVFVILLVLSPFAFTSTSLSPSTVHPHPSPSPSPSPLTFTSHLRLIVPIVQAIPGAILVCLALCSSAPSTKWNWLLVPFNPLPLCAWPIVKRKAVSRALGAVLLVWAAWMFFSPHRLVHPAYLVMDVAFAVFYLAGRREA